jgi:hypothetical protein
MWAVPVAQKMKTSKLLTKILTPVIMAWARSMAYEEGVDCKPSWVGKTLSAVGIPICRLIYKVS